jgi:hypothetical protein
VLLIGFVHTHLRFGSTPISKIAKPTTKMKSNLGTLAAAAVLCKKSIFSPTSLVLNAVLGPLADIVDV